MIFVWAAVLLAAVWAAHWGAERLSGPLKKLRSQWGFSVAAGGSFLGLASAAPEVGINVTSAIRGVGDIGLGALLGSNVIAIPVMMVVAYIATRKKKLGTKSGGSGEQSGGSGNQGQNHAEHRREHVVRVDRGAVTIQALPYLGIIALFAILTLPRAWRGLQPIDGWILLIAYVAYLVQALLRGRQKGEQVEWKRKERWMAAAGVGALAVGAYFTVFSTEKIVSALGISKIVGGLFITAPIAALPEVFATWYVARSGQVTSAVTSVIGDHVVTMTLAFIPLTIVGMSIDNMQLFSLTLVFVAIVPALYAAFIHWGGREHGFKRWQIAALPVVYAAYVALVVFWVQPFGQNSSSSSGQGGSSPAQNSGGSGQGGGSGGAGGS